MCSFTLIIVLFGLLCCASDCANVTRAVLTTDTMTTHVPTVTIENSSTNSTPSDNSGLTWRRNPLTNLFAGINPNPNLNASRKETLSKGNSVLLTRKLGVNAMLSSFIYSLSVIPLFLAITSIFTPAPHGFNGRRKRALVNESHIYRHLPLMSRDETRRFLSLFETTLLNRKIYNEDCKKYYSCKVFHKAIRTGSFPTLADFEYALLNVFGIVAERYDYKLDLIPTVKMYYEIATNAFKGISCAHKYPCSSEPNTTTNKFRNVSNSVRLLSTESNVTRTKGRHRISVQPKQWARTLRPSP